MILLLMNKRHKGNRLLCSRKYLCESANMIPTFLSMTERMDVNGLFNGRVGSNGNGEPELNRNDMNPIEMLQIQLQTNTL